LNFFFQYFHFKGGKPKPCRKFRYDEAQLEYFVQTADTIVVKKSELDAYKKAESMDPNQARRIRRLIFFYSRSLLMTLRCCYTGVARSGSTRFDGYACGGCKWARPATTCPFGVFTCGGKAVPGEIHGIFTPKGSGGYNVACYR